MKRILIVFMWLICFFILAGCSQKQAYITCTSCGTKVIEESKYCSECGKIIAESQEEPVDYTVLDSGICNSNVSWEIRSDGTLYVFGNGTIPNYENREIDGEIAPWKASAVCSEITDVLISDEITGIGEHAFYNMSLSSITFGHNVITYNYELGSSYSVKTAYIPTTMKDIRQFLIDTSSQYMTIYYEGTEEEWQEKIMSNFYGDKYSNYDIYYNCEY